VRLRHLRLDHLRAFASLELDLAPGWNLFTGPNGAGKTTLLEAAYLLSHGRSFRSGPKDALVSHGAAGFSVFGKVDRDGAAPLAVGLSRQSGRLEARVEGQASGIADLLRQVAVVCFEPGSHALIAGPAEERRRFLDWGVFHVEHGFVSTWRAVQRALKQRNALLRAGGSSAELDAWDHEFAESSVEIAGMRRRYFVDFSQAVCGFLGDLLAELGPATLSLDDGWSSDTPLIVRLRESRESDLRRGHTGAGPHRADWYIAFERAPRREHLSRGQEKLCALACVLAQAAVFAQQKGEWPVVCVDDLASELDSLHQDKLVRALTLAGAQILVTGTHEPAALSAEVNRAARFHVEPGQVRALL
jgi:DNA replication and repair protein RecF